MKTAFLITIIWILFPTVIISTACAIRFFWDNLRLEKQVEHLRLKSLNQAIELECLANERQQLNDEVLQRMLSDYDKECLIFMNTQ